MSGVETIAIAATAGVLGAAAKEIVKKQINKQPHKKLHEIVEDVDGFVEKLKALKSDLENKIQINPWMKTSNTFDLWNQGVVNFNGDVANLRNIYKDRISSVWNRSRRKNFRKQMIRKCSRAKELQEQGQGLANYPHTMFAIPLPKPVEIEGNAPEIKGFPTLRKPLEDALFSLIGPNKVIAICGMLGVGKTAVLQNVNNHERVADLFDYVIFLKVPEEGNEASLRQAVARRLKLDDQGGKITARSISEALKDKKCLLLLDDVRKELDLNQIGIPYNNEASKVIVTSRFTHVCQSVRKVGMVKMEKLPQEEAWKMFQKMVGDVIDIPGIRLIAQEVVEECDGLPFLIKAVASSFRCMLHPSLWRDRLKDLRCLETRMEIQGVNEMYEFLGSCYAQLKDDEMTKNCFLYGALFPGGSKIYTEHLLESWAEEGFFDSLNRQTHQDKLDKGHTILDKLTKLSLLEKDENDNRIMYIWMHNCIQEFALYESSKDPDSKLLVSRGLKSGETHQIEDWEVPKRISLIDSSLDNLPESPNCSKLLTLLLQRNSKLKSIPPFFFQHAGSLQLLNLHATAIDSLPSSVSKMIAMKALYLNGCSSLQELPDEICYLECLEVLDLRGTKITFIPLPIADLVRLKILRISYNKRSGGTVNQERIVISETFSLEELAIQEEKVISKLHALEELVIREEKVISKLHALEELVIQVFSYPEWCNEVVDVINQVIDLKNLYSLKFCFPKTSTLLAFKEGKGLWMDHLSSFCLFVGCPYKVDPEILEHLNCKIYRYLRYCGGELVDNHIIFDVIAKSEAVEVIEHKNITRLSDFKGVEAGDLYGFLFEKCHRLESIVDGNEIEDGDKLPIPNELYLNDLPSLRSVFEGDKQLPSVSRLKVLELKKCPALTKLISDGMINQLTGLQKLTIEECGQIEELIIGPNDTGLRSLQTLRLLKLPKLSYICSNQSLKWPSLEVLEVDGCPELKNLPFNVENAPRLRLIKANQQWWLTLPDELKRKLRQMCSLKF